MDCFVATLLAMARKESEYPGWSQRVGAKRRPMTGSAKSGAGIFLPLPQAGQGAQRCKLRGYGGLRLNTKLLRRINAILAVQTSLQKYSAFPVGQISSTSRVF